MDLSWIPAETKRSTELYYEQCSWTNQSTHSSRNDCQTYRTLRCKRHSSLVFVELAPHQLLPAPIVQPLFRARFQHFPLAPGKRRSANSPDRSSIFDLQPWKSSEIGKNWATNPILRCKEPSKPELSLRHIHSIQAYVPHIVQTATSQEMPLHS
jgi:hypothetical protein